MHREARRQPRPWQTHHQIQSVGMKKVKVIARVNSASYCNVPSVPFATKETRRGVICARHNLQPHYESRYRKRKNVPWILSPLRMDGSHDRTNINMFLRKTMVIIPINIYEDGIDRPKPMATHASRYVNHANVFQIYIYVSTCMYMRIRACSRPFHFLHAAFNPVWSRFSTIVLPRNWIDSG